MRGPHMPDSRHAHRSRSLTIDRLVVDERTAVLCLEGDLDLWSAPQLKSTLRDVLADRDTRLILDLGRVPFMDSTALGVMVGIQRRFPGEERVVVAAAAPALLRVFELSGLATGLRVFAN